jgi:hypothetical protein
MSFIKQHHKKTVFLFVLVYFISAFAIGFHHHDDDCRHFDCPICVVGNICSAVCIENAGSPVFHPLVAFIHQPVDVFPAVLSLFPSCTPRAPPFSVTT